MASLTCDLCPAKLDKPGKIGLIRILAGDKVVLCKKCRRRIIENAGLRARNWRQENGPSLHGWTKFKKSATPNPRHGPVTRSEARERKARLTIEAKRHG